VEVDELRVGSCMIIRQTTFELRVYEEFLVGDQSVQNYGVLAGFDTVPDYDQKEMWQPGQEQYGEIVVARLLREALLTLTQNDEVNFAVDKNSPDGQKYIVGMDPAVAASLEDVALHAFVADFQA